MSAYETVRSIYPFARGIIVTFNGRFERFVVDCPTLMGSTHTYVYRQGDDVVTQMGTGQQFRIGASPVTLGEALRG